jgi:peroxiredoxin
MKQLFSGLILTAMPFLLSAQGANNYTITGTLTNVHARHAYLTYFSSGQMVTDSADVIGDRYTLSGHVDIGTVCMLTAAEREAIPVKVNTLSVFVSPSDVLTITHTGEFSHAEVKGAVSDAEYRKLLQMDKEYSQKRRDLTAAVNKTIRENDVEKQKGLMAELTEVNASEKDRVYGNYMHANPSSPLLVFVFNKYIGDGRNMKPEEVPAIRSFFALLPDSIRNKANAKAFQQRLDNMVTFGEEVAVGRQAPDFTQNDTAGNPVSLSSFRGKYVLLDFWASWCGPCRQENPAVVEAYHKYHDKGLEILGVSLDQKEKSWKDAIYQDHLTWTHVSDLKYWDNALVKVYGIQGVPQNFLIDPNGKIVARGLRGEDLDKTLGVMLGQAGAAGK